MTGGIKDRQGRDNRQIKRQVEQHTKTEVGYKTNRKTGGERQIITVVC